MRILCIAPWPSLVNRRSEVNRARGRSRHRPTKLQTNRQLGIPALRTELITASNAALHIPLRAPAATLKNTIFRECRRKKAMIFIDSPILRSGAKISCDGLDSPCPGSGVAIPGNRAVVCFAYYPMPRSAPSDAEKIRCVGQGLGLHSDRGLLHPSAGSGG
jgi:hypothetical protein